MQSTAKKLNPKIVVVGSCSLDFTTYAPRLPKPAETLHGTKFTTTFGGKGANQCVAAANLGATPYMICRLGDDQYGTQYKTHLKDSGIDVTYVKLTPNVATGIAQITVAENGENQIVIVTGSNSCLSKADVEEAAQVIERADIVIAQLETPLETTLEAFKLSNGIKLLNAAPARCDIQEILPYCTILCVNECEASLLSSVNVDTVSDAVAALEPLLATGCETVIITLGEKGAVYSSKHDLTPTHVYCKEVTAVDTTGAGDAFVGALATFLITHKNYPMHQIVGAACHIATMSVTKEGTQTSYPRDCDIFNMEYKYERIVRE